MAVQTNVVNIRGGTNATGLGNKVREDLTDIIYNISPTERPFHQNVGRESASSDLHEWVIDSLADASDSNKHIDGDDFDGNTLTVGTRLGNYQQISRKDIVISRRADIVRKAGRRSELNYQIAKAGRELQRDCEMSATANKVPVAGSSTVAPVTGGIPVWLTTNTSEGTNGADAGLATTGIPSAASAGSGTLPSGGARVNGSTRTMTETLLLSTIASIYTEGGDPDMIMMHPSAKQRFSNYMFAADARIATQYQDAGAKPSKGVTAVGAVDVYVSDFGVLDVVPNRFQAERDLFVLDTEMWAISYLDGYHVEKIGKTGDSERRVLLTDWGVVSKNEAASGGVFDLNTTAWTK